MLVIRMQRTGRSGHAQFRVVVQDSRRTPTSGKIVASLGHYNPHTKETSLNKEKASFYLEHGAQPSDRAARLLKSEGVKLPGWVKTVPPKTGKVRNAEKRRSTRPAEAVAPPEAPVTKEQEAAAAPENTAPADVPMGDNTSPPAAKEKAPDSETAASATKDQPPETSDTAPEDKVKKDAPEAEAESDEGSEKASS